MLSRTWSVSLPVPVGGLTRAHRLILATAGWIGLATVLTLFLWALNPSSLGGKGLHPAIEMGLQRFKLMPSAQEAGTDWQTVTLPDTWAARHVPSQGVARYDIQFKAQALDAPSRQRPWGVRLDRLSFQHRLWINGHLIHSDLPGEEPTGRPLAYLAQFSPDLLKEGDNHLEIEVRYGSLGGLSTPIIGPVDDLQTGFTIQSLLTQQLPLMINIVAAAFAAFLIVLWLKRRSEVAMGTLGLLCVVVSVRNCTYYLVHTPTLPADWSAWLYFTAQTAAAVLLGWFAMAIAAKPHAMFSRVLWAVLASFPVLAGLAAHQGHLAEMRAVLYPALLVLMLPALALLLGLHKRFSRWSAIGMVLGIAVSLVAGVHDYLRMVGTLAVTHSYWLPLASPITLASYGIVLMHRFVEATGQAERLNIELEAKVDERTRALSAANAAKGHFLAAASHDLRQPVAAVGLLSGLLRDQISAGAFSAPLRDLTGRLCDAVQAMESLLSGLLDLSRLDAGAIRPDIQSVDLHAMLERIQSHEQEAARQKGLSLRVHSTQAMAACDPVLLEQMIRNLVGNALRYTRQGGVLVGVRPRGSHWLIQVWDTGPGIAPQDQQRIFEDFVQLNNPERNKAKGLGLGLAIVQRAARLLNMPIGLQSRLGKGSCFSIQVPRADARPQADQPTRHASPHHGAQRVAQTRPHTSADAAVPASAIPPATASPLDQWHVVVLDDDDTLRLALRERLRAWGAFVSVADSIETLDELLQRVMHMDLLITDQHLGDGHGHQAIHMARQRHPQLPAIIITGDTATDALRQSHPHNVPVLHKPFPVQTLLDTILTSPRCSSA